MDQSKIDKSCELTFREAVDIMNKDGAVTDGNWVFGTSEVRRLDGWQPNYVVSFEDFHAYPGQFFSLAEFEEYCKGKPLYIYEIPLTAEQAVLSMKNAKVVVDVEGDPHKRYFIRGVRNPVTGLRDYVFSTTAPDFELVLEGTPEEFMEGNGGPHFEVLELEEEKE